MKKWIALVTVFIAGETALAVPSPQQANFDLEFSGGEIIEDVLCFAEDAIFAIGGTNNQSARGRVLFFDGNNWAEQSLSPAAGGFTGIWGTSPTDVFVVGGQPAEVWHYDGVGWTRQFLGLSLESLVDVWGSAPDDVWAMGQDALLPAPNSAVIVHYDGSTWTRLPKFGHAFRQLYGFASDDIWATGNKAFGGTEFWHYDGTAWTQRPETGDLVGGPVGLWGPSSTDVFHAGGPREVLHWDGSAWTPQAFPNTLSVIRNVFGFSSDDVFAPTKAGELVHYDGTTWNIVPSNNPGDDLVGLCGVTRNELIVVGRTLPELIGLIYRVTFETACSDSDGDGYGSPGDVSCLNGAVADCNDGDGSINPGQAELCDGLDNNCSGTVDDGIAPVSTICGVGQCADNTGVISCVAGVLVDSCDPFEGATTEVCDGVDNNCDGAADDGIGPVPTTCGVGECAGNTGEQTCDNGALVDSCDAFDGSTAEVCDALDNDCDGDVDEGFDADGDEIVDCFDDCPFDADNDSDGDDVCGDLDVCADTVIPEGVPTKRLGINRFALTDSDTDFDTKSPPGGGNGPGLNFTTGDTAGCSCEQIIEALDLGNGHIKFGCSISAMEAWTALVNP